MQSTAVTQRDHKVIHANAGLFGGFLHKSGFAFLFGTISPEEPEWETKKMEKKMKRKEAAAAWTQRTQERVCWDLALASPRPPTLWLKQIPSSEPPPSLYLYLAVSTRRHETHYIKHRASLRKDPLVARSFSGRSASLSPTNYFNEYKTMS